MAIFSVIGDAVVGTNELIERGDEITEHVKRRGRDGVSLEGQLIPPERRGPISSAGEVPAFKQIGKGLPLQVVIDHIYTGKYPKKSVFGETSDVAVVSGVKDYAVFAASTRALNVLGKDIPPRSSLRSSAFEDGTPLVMYSPAVMSDSLTLSVELAVDSFDKSLFDIVARGLQTAAGIPLMLPYSGFLLGAGEVLKLAGGLGDALFDGKPAFSITETLNFGLPGRPLAVADHWLLTHQRNLTGYTYHPGQGLLDPTGTPYNGDDPYVVLTLDGRERPELNSFTPTAASAAVLEKFFAMKDRASASVETLVEGLQLVSDMKLRKQAEDLKTRIAGTADGPSKDSLKAELDAVLKNIGNSLLRPSA